MYCVRVSFVWNGFLLPVRRGLGILGIFWKGDMGGYVKLKVKLG
jgi:hypothetical protein